MKELLEKLSSYHIFNYLFPGVIFTIILSKVTSFDFVQKDIIVGAFLYYFIGLIISRVGSLVIEPFLKKISFLNFVEYNRFVKACKADNKIEILSEINNMYRTICSVILLIIFAIIYEKISAYFSISSKTSALIVLTILLIMFLLAYRKQTSYVRKRVTANEENSTEK